MEELWVAVHLLLALSGHATRSDPCPFSGGKADIGIQAPRSANDPKRTSAGIPCCSSEAISAPIKAVVLADTMLRLEPRGGHEAAGISRCSGRCGSVADCGACAGPQDRQDTWPRHSDNAARPRRRGGRMKRRKFIALIGGAATWPVMARGQATKIPRIGWIILGSPAGGVTDIFSYYDSFRAGLRDVNLIEGGNAILIARTAEGIPERHPDLIDELLHEDVSVIVSPGPAIRVVREKVKSTPVVFAFSGDPVAAGIVDTLARGKENLTGLSYMAVELNGKRLDLMKELVPTVSQVTLLTNPIHPGEQLEVAESQRVAAALGISLQYLLEQKTSCLHCNHLANIHKSIVAANCSVNHMVVKNC